MANDKRKQQKSSSGFPVKSTPRSKAEDHDDAEQPTKPRTNLVPNTHAYARGTQASTAKQIGDGKRLTLALDTKASKAKQADIAGLGPPKQLHARTTSTAGQIEGAGSANPGSSGISRPPSILTRRHKGKGKLLEIPVTNPGTRDGGTCSQNAQSPHSSERRESRGSFDGRETPLSQSMGAYYPETEGMQRNMQDEELAQLERDIAEIELEELERKQAQLDEHFKAEIQNLVGVKASDTGSSSEVQPRLPIETQTEVEVHEAPKLQDSRQVEQDMPEPKIQSAEQQKMYELQHRNQKLEDAVVKIAQQNQQLEGELVSTAESAIKQDEAALEEISALVSAAESAVKQEEAALEKISALERNVQTLSHDLEAKSMELDEVREGTKTLGENLTKMWEDVQYLANAVKQTRTGDASDTKALRDLIWKPYSSLEAKNLHRHIVRFASVMEDNMQATSADLEVKNKELATAQKDLQVLEESETYWKTQTEQAQKKTEQSERRLADWKVKAGAIYQPYLREKNRELRADLTTARDAYSTMKERMQTQKTCAQRWEAEFKTIKSRAEKESGGFELAYEQQRNDMMICMKAYHEKLKDPKYFELEPLHEKVRRLERDLQVTTREFDAVKVDKARIEEDMLPKILEQMREYEGEIEGLRDAWGRDGLVRAVCTAEANATKHEAAREEKTSKKLVRRDSAAAPSKKFRHVPRCLHPKETARREAELQQLRQKQARHRTLQDNFGTVMKQVHRWQMEENLWENQGWSYWLGKNSWDIWDGAGWASDVELDIETRKLVAGLKEQGFLEV